MPIVFPNSEQNGEHYVHESALMVRKSCAGQTHNSIQWNHSLCDFIRDMFQEVSLKTGLSHCSFVMGERRLSTNRKIHLKADFEEPTGSFRN